jgi:predicted acyl esterase
MSRTEAEHIDVALFENDRSEDHPLYPGFKPGSTLLKHGHVNIPGALPLPCDILWERDIAVHMRDGVKIYVDVYRPPTAKEGTVPAIIAGGPFGKNGGLNRAGFAQAPWRNGVPQRSVSSFEKFEGPDPAYHGYAIVHPGRLLSCSADSPDQRGTWRSEGNLVINCTLDGQDGYDLIEWIAQQPWSNGKCVLDNLH